MKAKAAIEEERKISAIKEESCMNRKAIWQYMKAKLSESNEEMA
jgi:hypothetical protein